MSALMSPGNRIALGLRGQEGRQVEHRVRAVLAEDLRHQGRVDHASHDRGAAVRRVRRRKRLEIDRDELVTSIPERGEKEVTHLPVGAGDECGARLHRAQGIRSGRDF